MSPLPRTIRNIANTRATTNNSVYNQRHVLHLRSHSSLVGDVGPRKFTHLRGHSLLPLLRQGEAMRWLRLRERSLVLIRVLWHILDAKERLLSAFNRWRLPCGRLQIWTIRQLPPYKRLLIPHHRGKLRQYTITA